MNKLNTTMLAAVVVGLLAGCASTSNDSQAPAQYPVLKVLSDKPYVWDDSISEALNVARMAQPAGVGNGMQDFSDGTLANTGRIGGGMRAFDAGLGLLSKGIFGVIQHEALSQGVNRQVDWKPTIVTTLKSDKEGETLFLEIREHIKNLVLTEVNKSGLAVEFIGVGTNRRAYEQTDNRHSSNVSILFRGEYCKKARELEGAKGLNMVDAGLHLLDIEKGTVGHCSISFRVTTPYSYNADLIVVAEMRAGFGFIDSLTSLKDSYLLVPDYFVGVDERTAFVRNYAVVYKNGQELLFEKK